MAVNHWWFGLLIDQREHDELVPGFRAAAERAVITPEAADALAAWTRQPSDFDFPEHAVPSGWGERANTFIHAFELSGFDGFASSFLRDEGDYVHLMNEDHLFRFVSTRQVTPTSIVWQVLGPERASLLPGRMGNLLLSPSEVAGVHDQVSEAYTGLTIDLLIGRALRYCEPSESDETALHEAITFLPDGLRQARDTGKGLLSLARSEC